MTDLRGLVGDGRPTPLSGVTENLQSEWRATLAPELYGPVPPSPDRVEVAVFPLPDRQATRLAITVHQGVQSLKVDAALWHPPQGQSAPLIAGLDFLGPIGVLTSDAFPLDGAALVQTPPEFGGLGRLRAEMRGTGTQRWPVADMLKRGHPVILSCYGSWASDQTGANTGLATWFPTSGALSLWAWALSRLLDAAHAVGVSTEGTILAGHSRLGKSALWAAAWDHRIGTVFAHQSGCAGAAPEAHACGETLAQLAKRFPHWLRPGFDPLATRRLDQQHLLATLAPRRVYLGNALDDVWADPAGQVMALAAAALAWGLQLQHLPEHADLPLKGGTSRIGWHLRAGGHALTSEDWAAFLDWYHTGT